MRDELHDFDRVVDNWIMALPKWLKPIMLIFTTIGEPPFTVGVAALVLGYGLALDKPIFEQAGIIALMTIILGSLLKLVLRRTRPRTEYSAHMWIKTYSFPSGHAIGSIVSYLMAAFIIANKWPEFALTAWIVAVFICFMIGISRIYLGAHYASDVIGGWIIGAIGLVFIFTL